MQRRTKTGGKGGNGEEQKGANIDKRSPSIIPLRIRIAAPGAKGILVVQILQLDFRIETQGCSQKFSTKKQRGKLGLN